MIRYWASGNTEKEKIKTNKTKKQKTVRLIPLDNMTTPDVYAVAIKCIKEN